MNLGEIGLIMAIGLILFGPEDLPVIARNVGRIVFEIRKATGELTREFQQAIGEPLNNLDKTVVGLERTLAQIQHQQPPAAADGGQDTVPAQPEQASSQSEELLTYEENPEAGSQMRPEAADPLAGLPENMVVRAQDKVQEKGASG